MSFLTINFIQLMKSFEKMQEYKKNGLRYPASQLFIRVNVLELKTFKSINNAKKQIKMMKCYKTR